MLVSCFFPNPPGMVGIAGCERCNVLLSYLKAASERSAGSQARTIDTDNQLAVSCVMPSARKSCRVRAQVPSTITWRLMAHYVSIGLNQRS